MACSGVGGTIDQMTTQSRQFHLVSRPQGMPAPTDFRIVDVALPELIEGQVLVRNTHLSVDPYMRGRMNDAKSYVPPFALDAPLDGGAIGVVEESTDSRLQPGDTVSHMAGWRTHAVLPAGEVRAIDVSGVSPSSYLGVLGMPGLTAYTGLTAIAEMKQDDVVFVSGAAGAVGSMVGQLARKLGASKVIGSAGSPEKVSWLVDELGYDAAFDYHDGPVRKQLAAHGPIDVYFDNVGGEHLEGAIFHLSDHGRIAVCGMIGDYNLDPSGGAPSGPRNMMMVVQKRLRMQGFIVSDHSALAGDFHRTVGPWVASGEIVGRETVVEGFDHTVDAFLGLFSGDNVGKMVVRLDA